MIFLKRAKTIFILTIALVFLTIILAVAFSPAPQAESNNVPKKYEISEEGNFWLGSNNPKVTIIEFADFSCSHCKGFYPNLRDILFKYSKDVKVVFKDYPILSENSLILANGARCAGEQNLFWPMHDKLYENQGQIDSAKLISLAEKIGANTDLFSSCLESEKYISAINKDFIEGQRLGVSGTPTIFINGYKLAGNIPTEELIKIIDKFLQ